MPNANPQLPTANSPFMPDPQEIEAERRRELARGLAPGRGLPIQPAAAMAAPSEAAEPAAAGRELARDRLAARNGQGGRVGQAMEGVKRMKELAELATATTPTGAAAYVGKRLAAEAGRFLGGTMEEKKAQAWEYFWLGFMASLQEGVAVSLPTLIVPVFLTLAVAFIYAFRLVRVSLLNGGKPLKFPLLGITDLYVSPLKFPEEYIGAVIWMTYGLVLILVVIAAIALLAMLATNLLGGIPGLQGLFPEFLRL